METVNVEIEKSRFIEESTEIPNAEEMVCKTSLEMDHSVLTDEQTTLLEPSSGVLGDPGSFQVNRRQIEEASLSEQETELQTLGLHVYDLDTLEQGILQQVDQALEEQEKRKLENEIQNLNSNINSCEEQIHRSSVLLKVLEKANPDQKKTISIKKNIENLGKQLNTLNARLKSLQQKQSCEISADDTNTVESNILKKSQETERERKIRLGEMTPFGSIIENKSLTGSQKDAGFSDFEKYLERQAELAKLKKPFKKKKVQNYEDNTEESKKETKKQRSPLKKNVLMPKKRKKKEKLGTRSSEEWWDQRKKPGKLLSETTAIESSGSEYLPSEDEESEGEYKVKLKKFESEIKPRRKVRRRLKPAFGPDSLEDWKTDDSDWEYSNEESRSRRRKKSKKEIDDGNLEDYHERLQLWEEQKLPDDDGLHELEGGYKMPKSLWSKLYKYQKVGVQWLWELNQQRCGGILGDEMGLGKTVQVIAFLAGLSYSKLMSRQCGFRGLGPCLIVCPTTVMHQWVKEFHVWWPQFRVAILHESGSFAGKREALIGQMRKEGCILVTSYIGVVQHQEKLVAKDWHYVILDEGHKIRNPDAQVTLAVKQFRTPHRIILSGSPMQNNLKELWSLFDFIFPGKLGTLPVFLSQMAVPITQGGYANASQVQVATAYRCATVLRDTIGPFLLRRMKADVKSHIHLPSKNEQVLFCCLTEEQRELYKSYLDSGEVERILQGRAQVFVGLINLRKICNHPDLYSGGPKLLRHEKEEDLPEESRYGYWQKAGKMIVVESLLRIWHKQGHRVLLFTQSRQMMCILEAFVQKCKYTYLKLDGGTGIGARQPLINKFNEDPSYFVFLLTTRVGGLGVNLTGADRVVIYDPDWNPATDTQARERAWRIGQQNQVTIYRLVTAGTIEEKIYHRQIFKQFLTNKVLKDPRQRRFFKSNDLLELFTLAESERTTETAAIFAGTGSEVKLKLDKKSKMKESPKKEPVKKDPIFSMSKLEQMKQLAQQLSKKIAKEKSSKAFPITGAEHVPNKMAGSAAEESPQNITSALSEGSDSFKCSESVNIQSDERIEIKDISAFKYTDSNDFNDSNDMTSEPVIPVEKDGEKTRGDRKKHKHKHKHKHKRKKGIIFEGERVDYLVGQAESQKPDPEEHAQQDDYVLRKLLKKTGVQTAMKHDMIMESGDPDYALVEGEAQRVAKEAVKALKESRRQCWQAGTGVPTWTGQSGALRTITTSAAKPRFGKKKPSTVTNADSSQQPMASTELLSRMRARNRLLEPLEEEEQEAQTERTAQPSSSTMDNPTSEENLELLTDIRNFVAFGASVDGRATTQEIVDHFKQRLPPGSSPLFKFLLSEVCEFHRMPSGEGVWKLRSEFQW